MWPKTYFQEYGYKVPKHVIYLNMYVKTKNHEILHFLSEELLLHLIRCYMGIINVPSYLHWVVNHINNALRHRDPLLVYALAYPLFAYKTLSRKYMFPRQQRFVRIIENAWLLRKRNKRAK